jgi:hypothetical protein
MDYAVTLIYYVFMLKHDDGVKELPHLLTQQQRTGQTTGKREREGEWRASELTKLANARERERERESRWRKCQRGHLDFPQFLDEWEIVLPSERERENGRFVRHFTVDRIAIK